MSATHTASLDAIRRRVLDRMARAERNMRLGIAGAAIAELALFVIAFAMLDWQSRLERMLFVFAILGYTIVVLGLVALGAHVTRSVGRVLAAMDDGDRVT
jgi:hypothetical protein